MAILRSVDGRFYEVPDDQLGQYEVPPDQVKQKLQQAGESLPQGPSPSGGYSGPPPGGGLVYVTVMGAPGGIGAGAPMAGGPMGAPSGMPAEVQPHSGCGWRNCWHNCWHNCWKNHHWHNCHHP